jgi:hypothetical protein
MVDNSENDKAERSATKPEIMNETTTAGPANLAAALPLRTKIPAPKDQAKLIFEKSFLNVYSPIVAASPNAVSCTQFKARRRAF